MLDKWGSIDNSYNFPLISSRLPLSASVGKTFSLTIELLLVYRPQFQLAATVNQQIL
jgi:hypothetical protein